MSTHNNHRLKQEQCGFALPAVTFVMAILGVLAVGSMMTTGDDRQAANGVREGTRAFYAAEAGLNALIAAWDSMRYDTLMANAGDSLVLGWTTLDNGCDYRMAVRRVDDGLGQPAYAANATGRSGGASGGHRTVGILLSAANSGWPTQGAFFGGSAELSGNPTITGACGGVHANGDITKGAPGLTMDGEMTATGTIDQDPYLDSNGDPHTPTPGEPSVPTPQLDPTDYCPGTADWILRGGYVIEAATMDSAVVGSAGDPWNWIITVADGEPQYELGSGGNPQPGTLCATGNVELSGGAGADGAPIDMSIIATGNVRLTGDSFIQPSDPDGIAILAGGDLWLTGSSGVSSDNFQGLLYANSQCEVSGSSTITGQIICANNPLPPGAPDITPTGTEFSGSITINFECTGFGTGTGVAVQSGSWMELFR